MRFTIAICTWNRAASLARTLASLQEVVHPAGVEVEVVVVNNGCSDDTDDVIARFAKVLSLQRVWQPESGLSHARNAAVEAATGDYILWTDDDVLIDRHWLLGYEEAFRMHPEAVFFGGPIEPVFEGGIPEWIRVGWQYLGGAFAERNLGSAPFRFDSALPFGANMALRMDEQRRFCYDVNLGRRPGVVLVSGEETAFLRTLLAAGNQGWWVPTARVQHCIPLERQTPAYICAYFKGQGFTDGILLSDPVAGQTRVWLLKLWWRAAKYELRYRSMRLLAGPERWVPVLIKAARARGALYFSKNN